MPSSSTRSTLTELNLQHFWRVAFTRLWTSNQHDANFITDFFAGVLEMSSADLMTYLKPSYHPDRCSLESYRAALKESEELRTTNMRMRTREKICAAGTALVDAGAALSKVGRNPEATLFCEYGSALWNMAMEEYNREEGYRY